MEQEKLDSLEINRIQKNILFTKQKYWLRSPKSLKLLSWKVHAQKSTQAIHAVRDRKGDIRTDTKGILSAFTDFYSTLYTTNNLPIDKIHEYLNLHFKGKRLEEDHARSLEAPISGEIEDVIKSLKNNKAPGDDGFGTEFYKKYATLLFKPLASAFNSILTSGVLPPS